MIVSNSDLIGALTTALKDYTEASQIKSTIAMDLHLGRKYMFYGLCSYFEQNYPAIQDEIIYAIKQDFPDNFFLESLVYLCEIPRVLCSAIEIIEFAITPRIQQLEKTISRLQNELNAA